MSKYDSERLTSSPVAPVPFGLYQLEEDDVKLIKRYAKELRKSPLKVEFQTSSNVEECYVASHFMTDVIQNICLNALKELIRQPPPNYKWKILEAWVEYRKKGDFLPPTQVPGGDMAFAAYLTIPYDIEEEIAHPRNEKTLHPCATKTQIIYANPLGKISTRDFIFTKADEGTILIYPSSVLLQTFPFYTSDEECLVMRGSFIVEKIK